MSGVFAGNGAAVATIADAEIGWSGFHGLPVIDGHGTVVFRADREDGVQGIYAARGGSIETIAETGDAFETLAFFPSANDAGSVAFAASLQAGARGSSPWTTAKSSRSWTPRERSSRVAAP